MRAVAALLLVASCSPPTGHPPVARIDLVPEYVPEGDEYATAVMLDGTGSCDEFDFPDTCLRADGAATPAGLSFAWALDAETASVEGSLSEARVVVRVRGDRPVTVALTVTDAEDLTATAHRTLGLVLAGADGGSPDAGSGDGSGE